MKQCRLPNVDRQRRVQQYKAKYQEVNFARMAESNMETHKNRCNLEIFSKDEKKLQKILNDEDILYHREISRMVEGRRVSNEKQMKKQFDDLSNEYQKEFEMKNEYIYDKVTDLNEGDIRRHQKVRENELQLRKLQLDQMNEKNILKMKEMHNDQLWHRVLMDNYEKQTMQEYQRKTSKRESLTRTRKAFEEIHEIEKQRREQERIYEKADELMLARRTSEALEHQHRDEEEQKKRTSEALARDLKAQFKDRTFSANKRNRAYQQRNSSFDALRFDRGSRPIQNSKQEVRKQLDLHAENLQIIKNDKLKIENTILAKIEDEAEAMKRIDDEERKKNEECRLKLLKKIYKERQEQIMENKLLQRQRKQLEMSYNEDFLNCLRQKNEMAVEKQRMCNLKKAEYARELRHQMSFNDSMKKQENLINKEEFKRFVDYENHFQRTAGLPIIMKTHLKASHPFEKIIQEQNQSKSVSSNAPDLPQ